MAHNNTEVEIKVKLSKKKFESIKRKLKKIAVFEKSSHHVDDYYSPKHRSFLKPKYPYKWLTIRKRDGKFILNYKHWYPSGVKYTTHCDEYETRVDDAENLAKILKALNMEKLFTIDKKRDVFVYKNKLEVVLDRVVGLGHFIEVESIKNFGGIEKAHEHILEFLKVFGIKETKTVPSGYGGAILRKKGLLRHK